MAKPPNTTKGAVRTIIRDSMISRSTAPAQDIQSRSQQESYRQLSLLESLEKPQEHALRIETVPKELTLGNAERFRLVHQESGLQVPGQFAKAECETILSATAKWNWSVDERSREPACRSYLLSLLESVCLPKKVSSGVAT